MLLALFLGVGIGLILGLTGAGGGMLAVPALVFALGWRMQQAAPVALLAVALAASIGAVDGVRKRLLRWRAALLMASVGIPAASLGHLLAQRAPHVWLQLMFSIAMLLSGARLLYGLTPARVQEAEADVGRVARVDAVTGRVQWNFATFALIAAIGGGTGLLTGLLGVGGGFVMVPLMRRFSNVSMHGIVATSLCVIALVGGVNVLLHWPHLDAQQTEIAFGFVLACCAGMLVGRSLISHLSPARVQGSFATVLLALAMFLLVSSLLQLLGDSIGLCYRSC